jgi:hypothetical protein
MSIESLMLLGAASVLSGCLATIYFYVKLRQGLREEAPSFIRYFAMAAILAIAAYFVGSAIGIFAGCRSPKSGNLCGIWGALGTGPLLAGVALWAYGFLWRKRLSSDQEG